MSRRTSRLTAVAALCTVGLAVTACSGTIKPATTASGGAASGPPAVSGGTLNMLGVGDVDYMDPNITYFTTGYLNTRMWSRTLFTNPAISGKNFSTVPDMATEMPTTANGGISTDGLTYTIKIKPGIKWNTSPVRAVTAADMVRGIMRMCNPAQPFGGTPDFSALIVGFQPFCAGFAKVAATAPAMAAYMNKTALPGVVATNDSTVTFKLTHPAAFFTDMLTMSDFSGAPVEYNQYIPGSSELAQHTISDGPYKVDSYVPTKSINYSRNPAWNAATDTVRKAYVDKIVVNETGTQDSIQQQLQTNTPAADVEWDTFPPPNQVPALAAKGDPNLVTSLSSSSNPYVLYNNESPNNNKALGNVKVRQALSYAINRSNIIQVLGGPKLNEPLTQILPSVILGGTPKYDAYPYNPTKAKQLLTEAGFPNGFTVKFLYRNVSQGSTKTFQTIQQDLSKIGVKVVGVPSPQADFYTKYLQVPAVAQRGVWDLSLAGWGSDWYGNAALSFFNPLFAGTPSFPPNGSNYGLYNSPTANAAITAAINAPNQEQAKTLWSAADHAVMNDAAIFPISNPLTANYHASQVHNTVYDPALQTFDPTNEWIDKAKQGG